jgi:hypothetical protein
LGQYEQQPERSGKAGGNTSGRQGSCGRDVRRQQALYTETMEKGKAGDKPMTSNRKTADEAEEG